MKRYLAWAAVAAFFIACGVNTAEAKNGKTCRTITGIFGQYMMPTIQKGLAQKCTKFITEPWFAVSPSKVDIDVGHSAGAYGVMTSSAKRKITIDPPIGVQPCPSGAKCTNYHNPWDAFPLIFCCGGYPVSGAENIRAPYGHVQMPENVAKDVLNSIN